MNQAQSPHLLLQAIHGEPVPRPPVWAMRQAGRWDPEFNQLRQGLSFYEFSENAELSAQASLLPRRFGVDAIILFYDITTLAVAMGIPFQLQTDRGPVPGRPIRNRGDVLALSRRPDPERFGPAVLRILEIVKKELAGSLPVLVFAGAPFTLASYCLGTGKDVDATRQFVRQDAGAWAALLEAIADATCYFLEVLAQAGADAFQLFDSWAGALTRDEYLQWAQPWHQQIFKTVHSLPSIHFVKECPYLDLMVKAGANVVSLGSRHDLARARQEYPNVVFQGNVSQELLRDGTTEQVTQTTRACVAAGGGRMHVVNLNHGVDRATPVANFEAYVKAVIS